MEDHAQAADGCRLPPELDDLALIAAIDNEADADVLAHLHACPHCAARARHFAEFQGQLRKQFFRMFCPPSEALIAYHQGRAPRSERASIREHLADCPHCLRELQFIDRLTETTHFGPSPPDPWNILNVTAREAIAGKVRRIFAQPAPNSASHMPYEVLRGANNAVQYAYHAENIQITIGVRQVAQHADRRVVVGLLEIDDDVFIGDVGPASASLLYQNKTICTTELDELGSFVLDDITPGTYRLALHLPDREVIIETLTL
jgi:hypothetical protein